MSAARKLLQPIRSIGAIALCLALVLTIAGELSAHAKPISTTVPIPKRVQAQQDLCTIDAGEFRTEDTKKKKDGTVVENETVCRTPNRVTYCWNTPASTDCRSALVLPGSQTTPTPVVIKTPLAVSPTPAPGDTPKPGEETPIPADPTPRLEPETPTGTAIPKP